MTPLHITTDVDQQGIVILGITGDLVTATVGEFRAAAAAVLTRYRVTHVVVDLARVASFDIAALNTLLRARDTVLRAGATFRVIRAQRRARRILHLTGTCQLLTGWPATGPWTQAGGH
jgi:anti-anti-sigma factor